jgi:hypothetical protein
MLKPKTKLQFGFFLWFFIKPEGFLLQPTDPHSTSARGLSGVAPVPGASQLRSTCSKSIGGFPTITVSRSLTLPTPPV